MPNKNYLSGRRFEYEVKKDWESKGCLVLRTAGSHGMFDLVIYDHKSGIVTFCQCKRVTTQTQLKALTNKWLESPPLLEPEVNQLLAIKLKGQSDYVKVWA